MSIDPSSGDPLILTDTEAREWYTTRRGGGHLLDAHIIAINERFGPNIDYSLRVPIEPEENLLLDQEPTRIGDDSWEVLERLKTTCWINGRTLESSASKRSVRKHCNYSGSASGDLGCDSPGNRGYGMTFHWRYLLKVAERLVSDNPEEQQVRSAVNRAYYAALGEAREFAVANGLVMKTGPGSHQQVWNFLRQRLRRPLMSRPRGNL